MIRLEHGSVTWKWFFRPFKKIVNNAFPLQSSCSCQLIFLSFSSSVCLFVLYFSILLSICLFVGFTVCLSVCLSICLFVSLSVCLLKGDFRAQISQEFVNFLPTSLRLCVSRIYTRLSTKKPWLAKVRTKIRKYFAIR